VVSNAVGAASADALLTSSIPAGFGRVRRDYGGHAPGNPINQLLLNASSPDGSPLTVSGLITRSHGCQHGSGRDQRDLHTAISYEGSDEFQYTVVDNRGGTTTATVQVSVIPRSARFIVAGANRNRARMGVDSGRRSGTDLPSGTNGVDGPAGVDEPGSVTAGANGVATLVDQNAPAGGAFYRSIHREGATSEWLEGAPGLALTSKAERRQSWLWRGCQ